MRAAKYLAVVVPLLATLSRVRDDAIRAGTCERRQVVLGSRAEAGLRGLEGNEGYGSPPSGFDPLFPAVRPESDF